MSIKTIDGKCYARMLLGGAAMLATHIEELNALNVFPVADGDTGTNMLKTIEGGLSEVDRNATESIGDMSRVFSRAILLSARGNSGVILSQIFAGISEGLAGHDRVDAKILSEAYRHGIEKSYAAVQNPVEGTILTVFRESTEYAAGKLGDSSEPEEFFRLHIEQAKRSLEATKELLPALAEADVVDSGGAGYLYIAVGMQQALEGREISYEPAAKREAAVNLDLFARDSVLEFGYCTEFLLRLTTSKVDPDSFDVSTVVSVLEEMGGESIVAYKQDDIVKVHVHTFTPGEILARAQSYGEFLTVKIENMNLGHTENEPKKKPEKKKTYSVVTVASGDGLSALFGEMGAEVVISGGQTSNPSIEDFTKAFDSCNAEDIIVLPNNKNVILAAKGAAEIYDKARIHVIPTKSIAEGYSALSVITPGIKDIASLINSATRAAEGVIDGEVTRAVRDAVIDGKKISAGDYMAISGGRILAISDNPEDAVVEMLKESDVDLCEIITLFVGEGVSAERRAELTERLKDIYDDFEITVYEGGQPVYDYVIAVE